MVSKTLMAVRACSALLAISLLSVQHVVAQGTAEPSTRKREVGEAVRPTVGLINTITFEGNEQIPDEILQGVIASRASSSSVTRRILEFHYNELSKNPYTPRDFLTLLKKGVDKAEVDLHFYTLDVAEADAQSIRTYYYERGFHNADVAQYFRPSAQGAGSGNALVFVIEEGERARVDTIVMEGLRNLPSEVEFEVRSQQYGQRKPPFDQAGLFAYFDRIVAALRNNGYFSASYSQPSVVYSDERQTDSVFVRFSPGTRLRVSDILFVDSTMGQLGVAQGARREQLDMAPGEWYSEAKVMSSINNIYALGVYDVVSIDTVGETLTDSSVAFRVFTRMRPTSEINGNVTVNRNAVDYFWNIGVEAGYSHNNIFGGAQRISPFVRGFIQDFNSWVERQFVDPQFEWQAGFRYSWPLRVAQRPATFLIEPYYSLRYIDQRLRLESMVIRPAMTVSFFRHTIFNRIALSWDIQRQNPINLLAGFQNALAGSATAADSLFIVRQYFQYFLLDEANKSSAVSSSVFEVNLVGDHRDDVFNPTQGYFLTLGLDFGALVGAAQYYRTQFSLLQFLSLSRRAVFAWKLRLGYTGYWGESEYVPIEKHFFAGGSNSVRGWESRQLRAQVGGDDDGVSIVGDIIGSGIIAEGSFEYRWKLRQPTAVASFWERQAERMGITFFADWGNTWNSYLLESDQFNAFSLADMVEQTAVAIGLGLRYDTPVGPLRLDCAFRLYDPMMEDNRWMWQQPFPARLQIGIGHAF